MTGSPPRTTAQRIERWMARAMRSDDPVACLARAAGDRSLPKSVRAMLAGVDAAGVRLSALLVARLRFERLVQGSVAAANAYRADAQTFAETFRAYHREVAIGSVFPRDEARSFEAWTSRRASDTRRRKRREASRNPF